MQVLARSEMILRPGYVLLKRLALLLVLGGSTCLCTQMCAVHLEVVELDLL